MRSFLVRTCAMALLIAGLACGREHAKNLGPVGPAGAPLASNQVLATNATVRFVDIEVDCWALQTEAGKYEPVGLPAKFKKDGLGVYVVMRGAVNMGSICQMAPLVTLDSIRAQ